MSTNVKKYVFDLVNMIENTTDGIQPPDDATDNITEYLDKVDALMKDVRDIARQIHEVVEFNRSI